MAGLLKQMQAWEGQRIVNVARGQANMARSGGLGALGLTQADKLRLGRAAARNLMMGTVRENRAKR